MALSDSIQDAIVEERNNFGDYSVGGDDLALAVDMAVLAFSRMTVDEQASCLSDAKYSEEVIGEQMPRWYKLHLKQDGGTRTG